MLDECGDATPIAWLRRDQRYVEKLATPDVTIADLIGDVDPIKAARGGHLLSDELTMHFGLLPRANRGIFAINELPDLSGKVQVGLFNIMQEGDVQIKGYPVRLPLDVLLAFTANPEDYTARGKIITPLKDRIGSEVITHYPRTVQLGHGDHRPGGVDRPRRTRSSTSRTSCSKLVERVAFEAREDKRVDKRSGVSQRLPISVLENAVSNAERRAVTLDESEDRAAGERRVRGGAFDHREARAGVRGRAAGWRHDRARADPARGRTGDGGAAWRRWIWGRSWPGSIRAARSRCRATSGPISAIRDSAWCLDWSSSCRMSGCRPGATRHERWRHASWCSRVSPRTSGSAEVRSWVTRGSNQSGESRGMAREGFRSARKPLFSTTHPSARALPTIASTAPSIPSASVLSTM